MRCSSRGTSCNSTNTLFSGRRVIEAHGRLTRKLVTKHRTPTRDARARRLHAGINAPEHRRRRARAQTARRRTDDGQNLVEAQLCQPTVQIKALPTRNPVGKVRARRRAHAFGVRQIVERRGAVGLALRFNVHNGLAGRNGPAGRHGYVGRAYAVEVTLARGAGGGGLPPEKRTVGCQ